jgi:hypothetical protein
MNRIVNERLVIYITFLGRITKHVIQFYALPAPHISDLVEAKYELALSSKY